MLDIGLHVTLQAKPGKEADVRSLLRDVLPDVQAEAGTPVWMALEVGESTFLIVDVHGTESDRKAHLNGAVAAAITARADELFSEPPAIQETVVLAFKPTA